jgi:hypothetical protein
MADHRGGAIFVSIAAFCDPHLMHTVKDMVQKAYHPDRLHLAVHDQHPESRKNLIKTLTSPASLRYLHVHPVESRGVCWARAVTNSLYQGEDWFLQIDSHMHFEAGWDEVLQQQIKKALAWSEKPIISTYPWGFEFDNKGEVILPQTPSANKILVLRPKPDALFKADSVTLAFRAEPQAGIIPVVGCHVAGGFLWTKGDFVQEVPYDPYLYFHGEEQSLALRAFTKGWDIYHFNKIPLFHLYKPAGQSNETQHWNPAWEKMRDVSWVDLHSSARARLIHLIDGTANLGVYGLGAERSLQDFAELSGIDYVARSIQHSYSPKLGIHC